MHNQTKHYQVEEFCNLLFVPLIEAVRLRALIQQGNLTSSSPYDTSHAANTLA